MKRILFLCLVCLCSISAWSDEPFRQFRFGGFQALPAAGENDVVFIGNSITNMMNWWEAFDSSHNIHGRGNSGGYTQEVLDNLESMIAGQPAKVFLMIGTNDLGTGGLDNPVRVSNNIKTICARIRKESPRTHVYCQSILPTTNGSRTRAKTEATNARVQAWIEAQHDDMLEYVDIYSSLVNEANGSIQNWGDRGETTLSYDNLHLSPLGYRIWMKLIEEKVGATCVIPEGVKNIHGGQSGSWGMRIATFGTLPVKSSDVLMIGDDLIHNGEWHELIGNVDFKDRGSGWGYYSTNIDYAKASIEAIFSTQDGKVSKVAPRAVVICTGGKDIIAKNNNVYSQEVSAIQTNYASLVSGIRAKVGDDTPIFMMSILPNNDATNRTRTEELNTYMKSLADASADDKLYYIPLYEAAMTDGARTETYFRGTGSAYPSPLGFCLVANTMTTALDAVLGTHYHDTTLSESQVQTNVARFQARKALGDNLNEVLSIQAGSAIGDYDATAAANYQAACTTVATALQSENPTTADVSAITTARSNALNSIVVPNAVNTADKVFQISTPNRGNYFIVNNGIGKTVTGDANAGVNQYGNSRWTLSAHSSGAGFNIVNRDGGYLDPTSFDLKVSQDEPSASWTFEPTASPKTFLLKSGSHVCNMRNSGTGVCDYPSGGTTDPGNQFALTDVTDIPEVTTPVVPTDEHFTDVVKSVSELTTGWYKMRVVQGSSAQMNTYISNGANVVYNVPEEYKQTNTNFYPLAIGAYPEAAPATGWIYIEKKSDANNYRFNVLSGHSMNTNCTANRSVTDYAFTSLPSTYGGFFTVGTWNYYTPAGYDHVLIGQSSGSANKWAFAPVPASELNAYDIYKVTITNATQGATLAEDSKVSYTGDASNLAGIATVYNNGYLILNHGVTLTAEDLAVSNLGYTEKDVIINTASKTITVRPHSTEPEVDRTVPHVVASQKTLVAAANPATPVESTAWTSSEEGGKVYSYNSTDQYFGAIANADVASALKGDQIVTVAAWVYGIPSGNRCIFGYGEDKTGIKFMMKNGTTFQTTTKGSYDFTEQAVANMQADQWNFVAFAFPGKASSVNDLRYYTSTTNGQYWTKNGVTSHKMNDAVNEQCAVGSGDSHRWREGMNGLMSNLTVIESPSFLNNAEIAALVGAAPTAQTSVAEVVVPTFTAQSPAAVTSGWYQMRWKDTNSDGSTGVVSAPANKFVKNHAEDVTVGSKQYPFYLDTDNDAPATGDDFAASLVYVERASANVNTVANIRSANGHYAKIDGSASVTPSNDLYIIYFSSRSYPTSSVVCSGTGGNRTSWLPYDNGTQKYIGQSATNKFPMVDFSRVDLAACHIDAYSVSVTGETSPVQLTYTGTGNVGLDKVYNGGTFFFPAGTTVAPEDFTATTVEGKTATVTIAEGVITVAYTSGGAVEPSLTKVTSVANLTPGLYIIKDVVSNAAQEARRGYVYMNSNLSLSVNTADRTKAATEILNGENYSAEYVWRLAQVGDKWTIECANGSHFYFPNLTGNGKMSVSTTAGQYVITNHATAGTLSLKCNSTFVNADPGNLSGWSNAHELEFYRIDDCEDAAVTLTYQTDADHVVATPEVHIPACKTATDLTYQYNVPDGYGFISRSGNVVTVKPTLKDGKTYYIEANALVDGVEKYYGLCYNGSGLGLDPAGHEVSAAYMWTCVRNGSYYTFRNVESGKYMGFRGLSDGAYNFTIDPTQAKKDGNLPLYGVAAARYMLVSKAGTEFNQATTTYNRGADWVSDYTFTECDPSEIYFSSALDENTTWIRLANCNNTGYVMTAKGGNVNNSTAASDAAADNQLFAFVGSNEEGFVVYNKNLGPTYTLTASATTDGAAASWQLNAANPTKWYLDMTYVNAAEKAGYALTTNKASNMGLNMYGGAGGDTKFYRTSDGGSRWMLSAVDSEPTIIHYSVSGTKKYDDANQWVGVLRLQKGSFSSNTWVTESDNNKVFNAYLPKSSATLSISNTDLHGWHFSHELRDGQYYVTYTADTETNYQYLGFRPDAQWYRIPAIVSGQNGDIVAIYDWRVGHNDVGFGEVDQRMRRSTDYGQTWSTEETIADGRAHGEEGNVFGFAFGDPALVADRMSGHMTLITVSGKQAYPNATATSNPLVAVQFSEDNGVTWSEPENITSQFWGTTGNFGMYRDAATEDASTTFAYSGFFGSGKLCQSRTIKVGDYYRIYGAMLCRGKNVQGAYVVYSDDMGHNWHLLGGNNTVKAAPGSDEPKIEELPDGSVLLSCRKYNGRYFNIWKWNTKPTTANPEGQGQWGTVVDTNSGSAPGGIKVGGNSCNGEILYVKAKKASDGSDAILMLQSLPGGNSRENVEIWYKDVTSPTAYTDVATFASNWTKGKQVSTTSSAYSTMCVQQDGKIGFFYEEGPATYCMVYVPLTVEDITGGVYNGIVPEVMPTAEYIKAVSDLKNAYNEKSNMEVGDGSSWLDYVVENPAALTSALNNAEPYMPKSILELYNGGTPVITISSLEELTAALQAINVVQKYRKGCFVRIQGYSGKYISMPTAGTNARMSADEDKTTILYLAPTGELISYATGLGLTSTSQVASTTTALNKLTLKAGAQTGKYYIVSDAVGIGTYLYDNNANGTKLDRNTNPVTSGSYQTDWTLTEVTELPVNIASTLSSGNEVRYNTLCSPVALNVPEGVNAYVCRVEDSTLHLFNVITDEEGTGVIPANTGVLLYAPTESGVTAGTPVTFPVTTFAESYEDNGFEGIIRTTTPDYDALNWYALQRASDGMVGFYEKTAGNLAGFHAYVSAEKSSSVRMYTFVMGEGESEGIETQELLRQLNAPTYDLSGRQISEPTHRGLYIIGGKKVIK